MAIHLLATLMPLMHVQPTWVDKRSDVFNYEIEADDRYYLEATSGFYRGQFGPFSRFFRRTIPAVARVVFGRETKPESTNWIGKGCHNLDACARYSTDCSSGRLQRHGSCMHHSMGMAFCRLHCGLEAC